MAKVHMEVINHINVFVYFFAVAANSGGRLVVENEEEEQLYSTSMSIGLVVFMLPLQSPQKKCVVKASLTTVAGLSRR